jgi:hypothetical protein
MDGGTGGAADVTGRSGRDARLEYGKVDPTPYGHPNRKDFP